MRKSKLLKSSTGLFGGALLAVFLAGSVSAATAVPYQARPTGRVETGYTEVRKDAAHYVVVYSAADEAQAKKFMELRAAQIGQANGFSHFVLDDSGTRTLTIRERYFDNNFGILQNGVNRDGSARNAMDYVPKAYDYPGSSKFYDVWGQVTFLTAEQARTRNGAVQISQVLAAQGK